MLAIFRESRLARLKKKKTAILRTMWCWESREKPIEQKWKSENQNDTYENQCLMIVAPQITDYKMVIWDGDLRWCWANCKHLWKRKLDPYLMPIHLKTFKVSPNELRDVSVSYQSRRFRKDGRNSGIVFEPTSESLHKATANLKTQKLETIYRKTSWAGVLQTQNTSSQK